MKQQIQSQHPHNKQFHYKPSSSPSQTFTTSTSNDPAIIKLHKYRHYLSTNPQQSLPLFQQLSTFALSQFLIGEYQLLHETIKQDIQKTQQYKHQRQQMISFTNPIRQQIQHAQSISSSQQAIQLYYKLALYYRSIAMHKQSSACFNKLFRLQSITTSKVIYQKSQYFSLWAQQLYFDNNFNQLGNLFFISGIFVRNQVQDNKTIDINLLIIKDLKYIEMGRAQTKFFQNLLSISSTTINGQILKNDIISLQDLGLLYSLVLLAKINDRQMIKRKVAWSSNIQVLYLQNSFKQLLLRLQYEYQQRGRFHPLISKLYNQCMKDIKQRVLLQYLSAFTIIRISDIQRETTYREGQLLQYLNIHPQLPYLIDPITQSLVYKQKTVPLFEETMEYGYQVREKWREMVRGCVNSRRSEEMVDGQGQAEGGNNNGNNRGVRGMALFGERRQGYDD